MPNVRNNSIQFHTMGIFLLLCYYSLFFTVNDAVVIPFASPSKCQPQQYFQFSSMSCQDCGVNQVREQNGLGCTCARGFKITKKDGGPEVTCQVCGMFETNTDDGWSCVKCVDNIFYDSAARTCRSCAAGNHMFDKEQNGNFYATRRKRCIKCMAATQPSVLSPGCKRCHQSVLTVTRDPSNGGVESCVCPVGARTSPTGTSFTVEETGGICFSSLSTQLISNNAATFTVNIAGKSIESAFFKEHLRAAQALCKSNQNFTACQLLGNLCVMMDYNQDNYLNTRITNTDACKEYLLIVKNFKGDFVARQFDWPVSMPWLYYSANAKEILQKTDITKKYKKLETFAFVLAIYSPNGSFIGIETDVSRILLCPTSITKQESALKFGTTFTTKCKLSVVKLWKQRETLFYDLYMFVNNEELYAIPVVVENFVLNGDSVNKKATTDSWKLFRRFFLVDNLSGKTQLNSDASVIRYAKAVELKIRLRNSDGQIYPPYLKILYDSIEVGASRTKESDRVDVSFSTSYEMDTATITKNVEIATGVFSGVGILYALGRTLTWRRRAGIITLGFSAIGVFLIYCLSALSIGFFAVAAGTCFQWLLFFKQQDTVYRLLPLTDQETLLKALVISGFVFKLAEILYLLYVQVSVEVFFLDWERPRGRAVSQNGESHSLPVSIMRTLFVANEWREVQTFRRIKPLLLMLSILLLLKVVGLEHLTTTDPVSRVKVDSDFDYVGGQSFVLRFALTSILFLGIGLLLWIFYGFIYERFVSDAIGDFVDFCSLSNISVFVLTHDQHGHYIHGRSVHGRADSNLKELYENFRREENNLCGSRGLEPNSEQQTFDVSLPFKFRENYNRCMENIKGYDQQAQRRIVTTSSRPAAGSLQTPLPPELEKSVEAYNNLNKFLASFVEHSYTQCDYVVRDKLLVERIFDFEIKEVFEKGIFYNDDSGRSFSSVCIYGVEWSLLLFDTLLFAVIDLASTNYTLATIVTFAVDSLFIFVRDTLGKKNLASKTLVDERFLI